jgi:hypothetical protein
MAARMPGSSEAVGRQQEHPAEAHEAGSQDLNTWPVATRPFCLLVTELGSGAFLVQRYPSGPTVYVSPVRSNLLREALDAAVSVFGSPIQIPPIVRPRI